MNIERSENQHGQQQYSSTLHYRADAYEVPSDRPYGVPFPSPADGYDYNAGHYPHEAYAQSSPSQQPHLYRSSEQYVVPDTSPHNNFQAPTPSAKADSFQGYGATPVDVRSDPPAQLTVEAFLRKTKVKRLEKERDGWLGWKKVVFPALTSFLYIAPLLPIMNEISSRAWVIAIVWGIVALIQLCVLEYWGRVETWHVCMTKGILVEFDAKLFLLTVPFLLNIIFIITVAILVYIAAIPRYGVIEKRFIVAALMIPALLFTIGIVKKMVEGDGTNYLPTLGTFLRQVEDPHLFESLGIRNLHWSQVAAYYYQNHGSDWAPCGGEDPRFQFNNLMALRYSAENAKKLTFFQRMTWGYRVGNFMRKHKKLER